MFIYRVGASGFISRQSAIITWHNTFKHLCKTHNHMVILPLYKSPSLVPRLPDLFNVAREKRGSLVKLITCVTSGGTNFHIWHNSELASSRGEISHRKLEFFELKGYESASGGPSVRSPCIKNCNLHGNSIVPTSKSVPPGRGHDRVTMQITVFDS